MKKSWLRALLCTLLFINVLDAQDRSRIDDPTSLSGSGWSVDTRRGALSMAVPLPTVNGPIPIPLVYRLNGGYQEDWYGRFGGADTGARPAYGTLNFGFLTEDKSYGFFIEPGAIALENGATYYSGDFTPLNSTAFGNYSQASFTGPWNLPKEFGLAEVQDVSTVKVNVLGDLAWYESNNMRLGEWKVQIPQGFSFIWMKGHPLRVVMDKNLARVFVYIPEFEAWAPLLWADKFGHGVTFRWVKNGTSGYRVEALNHLGKGVQVQWCASTHDAYISYIGVSAPSVYISGLNGVGGRPSGFAIANPPPGIISQVSPRIPGLCGRPTSITMGALSRLPHPTWSVDPFPVPSADGTLSAEPLSWALAWDANSSAITTLNEPSGIQTTFSYVPGVLQMNQSHFYGVSQAVSVDAKKPSDRPASKRTQQWAWKTANYTVTGVIVKDTFGSLAAAPSTEYQFASNASGIHGTNGATQVIIRRDKSGNVLSTTTFVHTAQGAAPSLSKVQTITITGVPGEPDRKVVTETDSLGIRDLKTHEYIGASGAEYQITEYAYDSSCSLLNLDLTRIAETKVIRKNPDTGITLLPSAISHTDYGPKGLPLNVYQRSSSGLSSGKTLGFDEEGRLISTLPYPASNTFWKSTLTPAAGSSWSVSKSETKFKNPGDPSTVYSGALSSEVLKVDDSDRPTQIKNERGVESTTAYDFFGRPHTVTTSGSGKVEYAYSPDGRTITVTSTVAGNAQGDEVKVEKTQEYDGFGRLLWEKVRDAVGQTYKDRIKQTYHYDEAGRLEKQQLTSSLGVDRVPTTTTFDALGRPKTISSPDGTTQVLDYSVSGNNKIIKRSRTITTLGVDNQSTSVTVTTTQYVNALGQTIQVVPDAGGSTILEYDGLGNLVKSTLTPAGGGAAQVRSSTYDGLGRCLTTTDPETNTITNGSFNALGLPTTVREASGRTRTLTYDGLGRVRRVTTAGGAESTSSLNYTYEGTNLTEAISVGQGATITTAYQYLGPGNRLSQEKTTLQAGTPSVIDYEYDTYGNLKTLVYPNRSKAVYGYGEQGLIKTITYNGTSVLKDHQVGEWGNRKELAFGSGAYSRWSTQDQGMHLKEWTIGYANTPFNGGVRSYTFDSAERLLQAGEWTLRHNVANQLISAQYTPTSGTGDPGFKTTLGYDGYGNNISSSNTLNSGTLPASLVNFSVNAQADNRMLGTTKTGAPTGWSINVDGEATTIGTAVGAVPSIALGWDGLGRLVSASNPVNNPSDQVPASQTYYYDANGMRTLLVDLVKDGRSRFYAYNSAGMLLAESAIGTDTSTPTTLSAAVHPPQFVITTPTPADATTGPRIAITKPAGGGYANLGTAIDFAGTFTLGAASPSLNIVSGPTYAWNFGDGGTASVAAPRYTFSKSGIYTVTLTVKVSTQPIAPGVPSSQLPITNHTFTK